MADVDIDLVVVNYKTYDDLATFLSSLREFEPSCTYSLTVVDVDGDPEKFELIDAPGASLIGTDLNIGYSRACNMGAANGSGRHVAFFNSDTWFVNDFCIDYCVNFLDENENVGIVGPLQYDSQKRATHGGIFGSLSAPQHRGWLSPNVNNFRRNEKAVTVSGSAFFVKRSVWDELTACPIYYHKYPFANGAFLPTPHYFEETWCSYHAQAHGHEVWFLGIAEMVHEWHKASPQGGHADKQFEKSKAMFVDMCEAHGIEHD
jgi:GT2 family glycosyltransferase